MDLAYNILSKSEWSLIIVPDEDAQKKRIRVSSPANSNILEFPATDERPFAFPISYLYGI